MDDQGCLDDSKAAVLIKKSHDTYYMIGVSSYNLRDYNGALVAFNESLKLKPDYEMSLLERGITYFMLEKDELAQADLTKSIALNPKSERAYYYRGKSKKYKNDLAGSCADLKMALSLGEKKAADELVKNGCK